MRAPDALSIYRPGLFDGKVAIVTGGGTGIGKAIAHELVLLGCAVVIGARKVERVEATAVAIRADVAKKLNRNVDHLVLALPCDIRNEDSIARLVQTTLDKYKRIDFLVNNAGGQFRAPAEKINLKGWDAVVRNNLNGTFIVTKAVYHAWMKDHGGSIVNIILVADKGHPMMVHSAAARAGIENMTKTLAVEWAASGIRLNCVAPGIILSSGADNYEGGAELFHEFSKKYTGAKRVGSVEECSAAVLHYLTPASAYTTGTTLHVDGGWRLIGPIFEIPDHKRTPVKMKRMMSCWRMLPSTFRQKQRESTGTIADTASLRAPSAAYCTDAKGKENMPMRAEDSPSVFRSDLFKGKVALVTGGGTGIGKCIAHELASLGCAVVIAARNAERIEKTANEIRAELKKAGNANADDLVYSVPCDIRSEEQVAAMVQKALAKYKKIDFLVNNAGGQFRAYAADIKLKGWDAVVRTNLNGTFIVTKAVYHAWMKDHGGSIVNIILVIDKGYPGMVHSAAARAGVENMSKTLSVEWASSGIRVNNVAPGIVLSSGADNYEGGESLFHYAANKVTTAKRVGSVEEVSAAVLYYLSPASAYTTGTTMHVDGGWHLLGPMLDVPDHENSPSYGSVKAKL